MRSSLFVQTFVACAASAVDSVILIRLLSNRLVTTPLYPRNSSSITSMSGQEAFPPKTARSRASSTDTNASTRRKRVRCVVLCIGSRGTRGAALLYYCNNIIVSTTTTTTTRQDRSVGPVPGFIRFFVSSVVDLVPLTNRPKFITSSWGGDYNNVSVKNNRGVKIN